MLNYAIITLEKCNKTDIFIYAVPMAYVFCQDILTKGRIIYCPIYMITFFEQIQAEENIYKFDLTGL